MTIDELDLTFHQETLRRQREILRRREADAAEKQLVSTQALKHAWSWTAVLRVMRRRMVADLRALGVETPVYWVATPDHRRRCVEIMAIAGANRVEIGRRYRERRRLEEELFGPTPAE